MIIVIVQLPIPPRERAAALESAMETAPRFQALGSRGLLKKYYLNGEAGGGGVYLWRSQAEAEAWYTDEWYERMQQSFGVKPQVTYYESLVQVDNVSDEICVQQIEG